MTAEPAPPSEEGVFIVPFFRAPSTDLNFTLALALVAVGLSQYFGVKTQKLGYFKKFIDFSGFKQGVMMGVIMVFVGLLELIAEFARIISFSFRLFGNIFAGEVLLRGDGLPDPVHHFAAVLRAGGDSSASSRRSCSSCWRCLLHPGDARARRRSENIIDHFEFAGFGLG